LYPPLKEGKKQNAAESVRAELLLSSKCCKDFTASPEMVKKKNFTSDKVYGVCSTHSSGEDSNDMEPFK
jgi:hypothetical protein